MGLLYARVLYAWLNLFVSTQYVTVKAQIMDPWDNLLLSSVDP